MSARHLSFVETGRSKPSRELVLHLAEHLEVPLRDRNALLLAAGYAPVYHETPFDASKMAPVRAALDSIVRGHEPYPAVVVDRCWDLVTANDSALRILTHGVGAHLLTPRANALRVTLHPDGLAPRIENLAEWAHHLLERLDRQVAATGAPELADLARELRAYPNLPDGSDPRERRPSTVADRLFVPLVLRHRDRRLRFFSTIAAFGTALDITIAELAIESFFPADAETSAALHATSASAV